MEGHVERSSSRKGSVFDYYINAKKGKFESWANLLKAGGGVRLASHCDVAHHGANAGDVVVHLLLDMMLELRARIMFIGAAGTGKTTLVKGKLAAQPEGIMSLNINFNYFTDVADRSRRSWRAGAGEEGGRKLWPAAEQEDDLLCGRLNMPKLDRTTPPCLSRRFGSILAGATSSTANKLTEKVLLNTQYLASMNPTAGSFIVNPRLQRLFATFAVNFPALEALSTIYATFMLGHLSKFPEEVQECPDFRRRCIFTRRCRAPSARRRSNFHYEFNIRHIAGVFQGMLQGKPGQFKDVNKISKLWLHESERVYGDRLVTSPT